MYIEKLTKGDIINFYNENVYKTLLSKNRKIGIDYIVLKYSPNHIKDYVSENGQVTFNVSDMSVSLSDYDFKTNRTFKLNKFLCNKDWLKFMYSKFGDEYLKSFVAFREDAKQVVIDKEIERLKKEYDTATNVCVSSLEESEGER